MAGEKPIINNFPFFFLVHFFLFFLFIFPYIFIIFHTSYIINHFLHISCCYTSFGRSHYLSISHNFVLYWYTENGVQRCIYRYIKLDIQSSELTMFSGVPFLVVYILFSPLFLFPSPLFPFSSFFTSISSSLSSSRLF